MTDVPPGSPSDDSDATGNPDSSSRTSDSQPELKPGQLPLGPRVFGKRAILITLVPFAIYWAGTALGSYLENIRKTLPVHQMELVCRGMAEHLQQNLPPEVFATVSERIRFAQVQEALADEDANSVQLALRCQSLLDAEFDDLPTEVQPTLMKFKKYVEHYLVLHAMAEENELNEIREVHNEFLAVEDPDSVDKSLSESWYPVNYSIACLAAAVAVLLAMPGYLKIPFRVSPLAIGVGVLGIVVWIGLWKLDQVLFGLGEMLAPNARAGFNPLVALRDNPTWMYTFLGIRLLGLVLVIPIAEEFFLRGFFMRYIEDIDWDQIPMGMATWKSLLGVAVYAGLSHPGEVAAAIPWFALVTWLYLRTKNVWDCVIAHAVTNLLLAIYVLATGSWELW